MKKVNVALIGYGHLGKWHAEKMAHHPLAHLVAIVEPFDKNQIIAKEKYPQIKVVSTLEEILPEIDAVAIVTPTSFHKNLVVQSLEAHKHVFCEKPLCVNTQELKQIEGSLQEDLVLQVGHSERFHALWDKVKDILSLWQDERYSLRISRTSSFKARATDVDVIQDLMIHDLDLVYFLFPKAILKDMTVRGYKSVSSTWDHVEVHGEDDNKNAYSIVASRQAAKEERSVCLTSSRGEIFIDLMKEEVHYFNGKENEIFLFERRDHLLMEHDHFYDSILNNKKAIVDFNDAKRAVETLEMLTHRLEEF